MLYRIKILKISRNLLRRWGGVKKNILIEVIVSIKYFIRKYFYVVKKFCLGLGKLNYSFNFNK